MDEMDRLLRALPEEGVPDALAARIREAVRRRHQRRLAIRRAAASALAVLGIWLLWPGIAWASSGALFSSGAAWLVDSLQYLNYESADAFGRMWSGTLSAQGAIGSTLAVSILVGALLLCCAIFLAIDPATWLNVPRRTLPARGSTILASGLHP